MPVSKSPAMRGHDGRSVSVQLGGIEQTQYSAAAGQWEAARSLERDAVARVRSALLLRGGERIQQVAIAAALFGAARSVALNAGGAR